MVKELGRYENHASLELADKAILKSYNSRDEKKFFGREVAVYKFESSFVVVKFSLLERIWNSIRNLFSKIEKKDNFIDSRAIKKIGESAEKVSEVAGKVSEEAESELSETAESIAEGDLEGEETNLLKENPDIAETTKEEVEEDNTPPTIEVSTNPSSNPEDYDRGSPTSASNKSNQQEVESPSLLKTAFEALRTEPPVSEKEPSVPEKEEIKPKGELMKLSNGHLLQINKSSMGSHTTQTLRYMNKIFSNKELNENDLITFSLVASKTGRNRTYGLMDFFRKPERFVGVKNLFLELDKKYQNTKEMQSFMQALHDRRKAKEPGYKMALKGKATLKTRANIDFAFMKAAKGSSFPKLTHMKSSIKTDETTVSTFSYISSKLPPKVTLTHAT